MSKERKPQQRKGSWGLGLTVEFLILSLGLFVVDGNMHSPTEILSGAFMLIFLIRLFVYARKE